jgi:hypothetical protein
VKNIGAVKLIPINPSKLARNSKNLYLMKNSCRTMQKNTSMVHEKGRMKWM